MKIGDIFTEENALLDERALRDHYIKKGFLDAEVSHQTKETADGVKITYTAAIRFFHNGR